MVPWIRIVVTALVAVVLAGASVFAVAALVPRDSSESLPDVAPIVVELPEPPTTTEPAPAPGPVAPVAPPPSVDVDDDDDDDDDSSGDDDGDDD